MEGGGVHRLTCLLTDRARKRDRQTHISIMAKWQGAVMGPDLKLI